MDDRNPYDRNPYAPSRAILDAKRPQADAANNGIWRDGAVVVTVLDGEMPDRCVKCNEPADEPTKARKVYWHHPALYVLVLVSIPIYAIVAIIVRKKSVVAAGLCAEHKKRRRLGLIVAWSGVLLFAAASAWFANSGSQSAAAGVFGLSFLAMLIAILVGGRIARVVYARKIDKEYVWLKGCGPDFVDSLPQFPG